MTQKTYDDGGTYRKPRQMRAKEPDQYNEQERAQFREDTDGLELPDRKAPTYPRTGVLMMIIRKQIGDLTKEPWHAVVKLRPVSDDPYCACQVYARMPGGETEWVAEFTPDEMNQSDIDALCNDIVRMRQDAIARPEILKPEAIVTNADGDVTDNRAAGQRKVVTFANGNSIEVKVRTSVERESEADERTRTSKEIYQFPMVMMMSDKDDWVGWNGNLFHIIPGVHEYPKPVADIWMQSMTEMQRAKARMSAVLTDAENWQWRANETRGSV